MLDCRVSNPPERRTSFPDVNGEPLLRTEGGRALGLLRLRLGVQGVA